MSGQFNFNSGEILTSVSAFPLRFNFGGTICYPLLTSFSININPQNQGINYIQGGAGQSFYRPAMRNFDINFSFPVQVDINKKLDIFTQNVLNYSFPIQNQLQIFSIETSYFKTALNFFTTLATSNYSYNDNLFLPYFNSCYISNFKISSTSGGAVTCTVSIKGTLSKGIESPLFIDQSALTGVTSFFNNNKIITFADCNFKIAGSLIPSVTRMDFSIEKQIKELKFVRTIDNHGLNTSAASGSVLFYSNDFPGKTGISSFVAKMTTEQTLRRIDESLYYSRGGINYTNFFNWVEMNFGPITLARKVTIQDQTQPSYDNNVLKYTNNYLLLKTPMINKADFMTIRQDSVW